MRGEVGRKDWGRGGSEKIWKNFLKRKTFENGRNTDVTDTKKETLVFLHGRG